MGSGQAAARTNAPPTFGIHRRPTRLRGLFFSFLRVSHYEVRSTCRLRLISEESWEQAEENLSTKYKQKTQRAREVLIASCFIYLSLLDSFYLSLLLSIPPLGVYSPFSSTLSILFLHSPYLARLDHKCGQRSRRMRAAAGLLRRASPPRRCWPVTSG